MCAFEKKKVPFAEITLEKRKTNGKIYYRKNYTGTMSVDGPDFMTEFSVEQKDKYVEKIEEMAEESGWKPILRKIPNDTEPDEGKYARGTQHLHFVL